MAASSSVTVKALHGRALLIDIVVSRMGILSLCFTLDLGRSLGVSPELSESDDERDGSNGKGSPISSSKFFTTSGVSR